MADTQVSKGEQAEEETALSRFVESAPFRNTITGLILFNAVILGASTYPARPEWAAFLDIADRVIVYAFLVELILKLMAWRFNFFKSGWNWFDFIIVSISLIPAAGALTVLRALRVLRLFRLFSVLPEMRTVVEALGKAIPSMGAILTVLMLIFYVAAVMGSKLFSQSHPEYFGDLGSSAFTLFQVMTLESWAMEVARPIIEVHPFAWVFFVAFIILTSFAVLNLFIAVIVDSLQSKHQEEDEARDDAAHKDMMRLTQEISSLKAEIEGLRVSLTDHSGRPSAISSKDADRDE